MIVRSSVVAGRARRRPLVPTLGILALSALLLSGCSIGGDAPASPEPSASTEAPTEPAVLIPGGSAEENLPFFDQVNRATLAANPEALGREIIDGLVAAGFDKSTMQVGSDTTTLGRPVDALEFAVRWGDQCLLGQNGPTVGGYHSTVSPALNSGGCLVGSTRPIDW